MREDCESDKINKNDEFDEIEGDEDKKINLMMKMFRNII